MHAPRPHKHILPARLSEASFRGIVPWRRQWCEDCLVEWSLRVRLSRLMTAIANSAPAASKARIPQMIESFRQSICGGEIESKENGVKNRDDEHCVVEERKLFHISAMIAPEIYL